MYLVVCGKERSLINFYTSRTLRAIHLSALDNNTVPGAKLAKWAHDRWLMSDWGNYNES